jgi:hypothetical protein
LFYFWPTFKKKKAEDDEDPKIEMSIEPMCQQTETWLVPCSEIYEKSDTKNKQKVHKYRENEFIFLDPKNKTHVQQKQIFALCFALHKKVLQIYELEASWTRIGGRVTPLKLKVVGLKMLFNC